MIVMVVLVTDNRGVVVAPNDHAIMMVTNNHGCGVVVMITNNHGCGVVVMVTYYHGGSGY